MACHPRLSPQAANPADPPIATRKGEPPTGRRRASDRGYSETEIRTGQSAGKAKQRATGPFTDPASGLQTIVVSIDPADAGGEAGALAPILAGPAQEFDFVLVVGHPLSHPAFSPEPIDGSDLVIFALSSADWTSGAASWLGGRLSPAVLKRSATIVIERDPDDPAEFQDAPAVAARKNRGAPAPAHG